MNIQDQQRVAFTVVENLLKNPNTKLASAQELSKEDCIELGLTNDQLVKMEKMASHILYRVAEGLSKVAMGEPVTDKTHTDPTLQGSTPLQAEMKPGAVPTNHAEMETQPGTQAQALEEINKLIKIPTIETSSGEPSGAIQEENKNKTETTTLGGGSKEAQDSGTDAELQGLLQGYLPA
jgi:hypothetical protein